MRIAGLVALLASAAGPARAQQRDTVRLQPTDSALAQPPTTPRKAFFRSVLVPGLGQATLDRKYTGAAFFLVEAFSIAFVHRSAEDLRTARAFLGDSVPLRYQVDEATGIVQRDGKGDPIVAAWAKSGYTNDLLRARKLQLEDWVAVLIFNHLIAGADAFVAAQLWDLPQHVKVRAFPVKGGAGVGVEVRVR